MGIENLCFGHSFECMDPSISILGKKSRKGEEFEKKIEKKKPDSYPTKRNCPDRWSIGYSSKGPLSPPHCVLPHITHVDTDDKLMCVSRQCTTKEASIGLPWANLVHFFGFT